MHLNEPISDYSKLSTIELKRELARVATALNRKHERNFLRFYRPYTKQRIFHDLGHVDQNDGVCERLFMAGNQLGKTLCGGAEWAIHATGRYPDWWNGAVFQKPPKLWVGGVTGVSTRDNPQRILVGPPQIKERWGTGTIPGDALKDATTTRGVADALDSVVVRHGGGGDVQQGESIVMFKAYEQGREKWQGDTVDGVWFDEEPPLDIYSEGRTRTQAGQLSYFTIITFTPLLGMSQVVRLFLTDKQVSDMEEGEKAAA